MEKSGVLEFNESNLNLYSVEEIIEQIKSGLITKKASYCSFYISPDGRVLNCRYPNVNLNHSLVAKQVYNNLDKLTEIKNKHGDKLFNSCVGNNCEIKDVRSRLMDNAGFKNVDEVLYSSVPLNYLHDDEVICHDMGFVKVLIRLDTMQFYTVLPLAIFNDKYMTATQESAIIDISSAFGIYFQMGVEDNLRKAKRQASLNLQNLNDLKNEIEDVKSINE